MPIGKSESMPFTILRAVFPGAAALNTSAQKKIEIPRNADVGWERVRKAE